MKKYRICNNRMQTIYFLAKPNPDFNNKSALREFTFTFISFALLSSNSSSKSSSSTSLSCNNEEVRD